MKNEMKTFWFGSLVCLYVGFLTTAHHYWHLYLLSLLFNLLKAVVIPVGRQTEGSIQTHNLLNQGLPVYKLPSNSFSTQVCVTVHAHWLLPLEVKLAPMMSFLCLKALVGLKALLGGIGLKTAPGCCEGIS